MKRLTLEEYGCLLALAGKSRSEDPFTQVSAVGFNNEGRILTVAYNGLKSKQEVPEWMSDPNRRAEKTKLMIHAEINYFSFVKRNETELLCLTINPCIHCCPTIVANNVKRVVYIDKYELGTDEFVEYFKFHGVDCRQLTHQERNNIKKYINETNRKF